MNNLHHEPHDQRYQASLFIRILANVKINQNQVVAVCQVLKTKKGLG